MITVVWTDRAREHISKHGGSESLFAVVLADGALRCLDGFLHEAIHVVDGRRWRALLLLIDGRAMPITMYPLRGGG